MSILGNRFDYGGSGPQEDQVVGENIIGGPLSGKDVRMYLDAKTLDVLLDVAKQSLTNRAVLHGVGLKVTARRGGDGNTYEVWSIVSLGPKAERSTFIENLTGRKNKQ
tara:strand:- start:79 stop:402 length:324 start_codon:yes stop_codon:yes gene_type:complete